MTNTQLYRGFRYPREIISHVVWLYFRFSLSFRDIEELMASRCVIVTYETIRQWALRFGQQYAAELRRRQPRRGDKWHLDEVVLTIKGEHHYLWRAVDQDGHTLDVLVQSRRNRQAAKRFFRKLLKGLRYAPRAARTNDCRRVGAICSGVFALGAAGVLNGRTVTTHWMDVARLASMFRRAVIEPDRIFVKDGSIYTTVGVTAGIDLSLVFIEEDFGDALALAVAKYLIVYLRRSGGQSQFSPLLEVQAKGGKAMESVLRLVSDRLHERHTLESLAAGLGISARHLTRMFKKECAMSPMNFVGDVRIDMARRLLESTDLSVKEIAERCGIDSADGLRRVFTRRLNVTPADYRRRFRSNVATMEMDGVP